MTNEKVIEYLNDIKYITNSVIHNADERENVQEALNKSIKALEQTKWIPCAEGLPKTNDVYLVSMHSYGLPTRDIDGYIQQTDKKWEVYGNKVIAWMPLPEPYKAEAKIEQV